MNIKDNATIQAQALVQAAGAEGAIAFVYIADLKTYALPFDRLPALKGATIRRHDDVDYEDPITYLAAFQAINQFAEEASTEEFGEAIVLWWEQCAREMEVWLSQK